LAVAITPRAPGINVCFGVDVDHGRINLGSDLRKRVGKRYRIGDDQGR
jgi:hypothetical protein